MLIGERTQTYCRFPYADLTPTVCEVVQDRAPNIVPLWWSSMLLSRLSSKGPQKLCRWSCDRWLCREGFQFHVFFWAYEWGILASSWTNRRAQTLISIPIFFGTPLYCKTVWFFVFCLFKRSNSPDFEFRYSSAICKSPRISDVYITLDLFSSLSRIRTSISEKCPAGWD